MTTTAAVSKSLTPTRPRWLTPLIVFVLLIASAMAVTLLTRGPRRNADDLDPANPGFSGAQALAHVLSNHGVRVTVVRSQRELLSQVVDGATTVAITGTSSLSGRTAHVALIHAASAASLVLLDPDPEVTKGMGLPAGSHLADLTNVAAGCRGTDVGAGFRLAHADRAYTPTASGSVATTCFHDKSSGGGALVSLPATAGRPPVILIGDESLIVNGLILDSDNAGIALHLFGHTDRLVCVWSGTSPLRPTSQQPTATRDPSRRRGSSPAWHWGPPPWCSCVFGGDAVSGVWSPNRCRSSFGRWRRPRAADGCTASPMTAAGRWPFFSRRREDTSPHTSACPPRLRSAAWQRPVQRSAAETTKMCCTFWNPLQPMTIAASWN